MKYFIKIIPFLILFSCAHNREIKKIDRHPASISSCFEAVREFFFVERDDLSHLEDIETRKIVDRIESVFKKRSFWSLFSKKHYRKELEEFYSKTVTYQNLEQGEYNFGIHAKQTHRLSILQKGFLNSHESGFNYVNYDGYTRYRDKVEAGYLSYSPADYNKHSQSVKPKYGVLRPKIDSGIKPTIPMQYGTDVWILKKDQLKDRTSYTFGDSLNSARMLNSMLSKVFGKYLRNGQAGIERETFIPWKNADLLIPFLEFELQRVGKWQLGATFKNEEDVKRYVSLIEWFIKRTGSELDRGYREYLENAALKKEIKTDSFNPSMHFNQGFDYVELQYWGPMNNPELIDSFIFYKDPPTAEEMEIFKQHNIKVYDGRDTTSGMGDYSVDEIRVPILYEP